MAPPRILIIYNADGGLVNGALDLLHKTFSPATYACGLCAVTYGPLGMKPEWRAYLATLPHPIVFHHRNDFAAAHPQARIPLPAILLEADDAFTPLVPATAFAAIRTLPELQATLSAALARRASAA